MPAQLVCGLLDFNDPSVLKRVLVAARELARDPANWRILTIHRDYYFSTTAPVPSSPGWYLICDDQHIPLYVGKAADLARRLDSTDGSRDNFANSKRKQDPERNFIKLLRSKRAIAGLHAVLFEERKLLSPLDVVGPLSDLDRGNVEKILNIFRCKVLRHAF